MKAGLCFTFLALGWLVGCAHSAVKPVKPSEVRVTTNRLEVERCTFIREFFVDFGGVGSLGSPGDPTPTQSAAPLTVLLAAELQKVAAEAGGDTVLVVETKPSSYGEAYLCRK
jgi:hypothetical protein